MSPRTHRSICQKDTGQMRDIMMRIPRYVDLTIATDGGKKFKVGSSDQTLWQKSCNIQMIHPILSKLIFKCCSEEWLKKSFYLLKCKLKKAENSSINIKGLVF